MQLSKAEIDLIAATSSDKQIRRKARNISLNDEQFERFQKACDERGLAANKVIDALIGLFLESPKE